ncbi:hypothetical protein PghCCS26_28410 [Paenibacillus glycanilyticus]|uniref:Uncharacterized protein n=1 Tax=Paenibacillus glycanilyticus TaxID=126569 RepID=A0ABQ6NMF6_9BACL|nr:hypothetical protein PghCCS26_28410 [Paenibacillus glycanilyticus]
MPIKTACPAGAARYNEKTIRLGKVFALDEYMEEQHTLQMDAALISIFPDTVNRDGDDLVFSLQIDN